MSASLVPEGGCDEPRNAVDIAAVDLAAKLALLCEAGCEKSEPVRLRQAEVLLGKLQAQQGRVRALLNQRLDVLLDALHAHLAPRNNVPEKPLQERAAAAMRGSPGLAGLHDLVACLQAASAADRLTEVVGGAYASLAAAEAEPVAGVPVEPKSLRYFRNAWSKLSEEQRLLEAMADLPENAGPLNAHLLMHRALQRMNALSPDYLGAFLSYAETLVWLEAAQASAAPARR